MPAIAFRALTCDVSRALDRCEITHIERQPIDVALARRQHDAYEDALRACGCAVERLPEEPELPDSVFVEDTALVLDEVAVLLRPGALSRRPEVASVGAALARYCAVESMSGPGTIDGGDLLRLGRTIYVGLSTRSNEQGIEELGRIVGRHGYEVRGVALTGCLHLKSAATEIAGDLVVVNPQWVDAASFAGYRAVAIDPSEPSAANALRIGERLIYPSTCPATATRLAALGLALELVDLSELAKAEGAVTCCSLIISGRAPGGVSA